MSGPKGKNLFDESGLVADGIVALTVGAPGGDHLISAAKTITDASAQLMTTSDSQDGSMMQYGPQLGAPFYREELAKFLSEGYGDHVNSDNLMLTAGATHGLHFIATTLLGPNAIVFIEDPTYFLAITMLRDDFGMKIVPVSTDEQGIDVDDLEKKLEEQKGKATHIVSEKRPFWAVLYIIPTYNNPQSSCLHPDRCRKIIELARKHDILVFCDDVYNLMTYTPGPAPSRLFTYDKPSDPDYKANVLSNGTFAKILSPALRVGWIEAGERLMKLFHQSSVAFSGGAMNHWTSQVVAMSLKNGTMQKHLKYIIKDLKERKDAVCQVLKENLPDGSSFITPEGGYFIWIKLPEKMDSVQITTELFKEYNIRAVPGHRCSPSGSFKNCIRISFSHYEKDVQVDAVTKLCQVINRYA